MLKNISIIVVLLLIFSCKAGKTYRNHDARYQVKYPTGWLALNSNHNRDEQSRFIGKIANKDTLVNYKGVDVVFLSPSALPPDYGFISVNTIPSYVNLNKLDINFIEQLLLLDLSQKFESITVAESGFTKYGKFKAYRMIFNCRYLNSELMATAIIVQGNLFSTQVFTSIYKTKDQAAAQEKLETVIASYKRI